jgi:valyl-tRNA synthetase
MRKTTYFMALMLFAASSASIAMQQSKPESYRYRWHDSHGQSHFSDSLTAQAIKNGYDVINNSGMIVRHVQRTLTPDERKAAQAAAAKATAARAAAQRQHSQDIQMLNAYPNLRVFKDAQQAEVDQISQSVRTTRVNLKSQEENLAALLAHVADIKHSGKSVPAFMSKRIDKQRAAVTEQRAALEQQKKAKIEAEKQMQERIERYRKLSAQLNGNNR